ncbi:MAG TPA: hypothetical protein VKD69_17965 [Vicinamibacterales bacterium]|nr:hypothetical protein [Vicinamibacterales bacterium]
MMRRLTMAGAILLLVAATAHAQSDAPAEVSATSQTETAAPDSTFLRVALSPSRMIASSDFRSGTDAASGVSIEIGRQTNGGRAWHGVYNYPSYGVGFAASHFDREPELGRPLAVYGFFSWPFPVAPRLEASADVGMGVAWSWKPFNAATNPTNTAIGGSLAYQVSGAALLHYLATAHASVYGGLNVTHWSNGGTRQPNLGLAVIGPQFGVRYDFAPRVARPRERDSDRTPFSPAWEIVAGAGGSSKNVVAAGSDAISDRRRSFGVVNVTAALQRHFYRFGKLAAGTDATYDGAAGARVDIADGRLVESRAPGDRRLALGVYGGYEHVMARFSVLLHVGYTVSRGVDDPEVPRLYERYGARYQLTDHLWTMFAVRAVKGRKANFMELGAGYRARF